MTEAATKVQRYIIQNADSFHAIVYHPCIYLPANGVPLVTQSLASLNVEREREGLDRNIQLKTVRFLCVCASTSRRGSQ